MLYDKLDIVKIMYDESLDFPIFQDNVCVNNLLKKLNNV
jgi:hypothetical protein